MSMENPFNATDQENSAKDNDRSAIIEHYNQRLAEIQKQREEALEKRTSGAISGVQLDEINQELDHDSEMIRKNIEEAAEKFKEE